MELQFSFFLNTFGFIFLIMLLWAKHQTKNKKLPPGPWKLPLIGSLHHLVMEGQSLPHHRLRELAKKHGDLMHFQLGKMSVVVVSSPKMAKELLKTHNLAFANRHQLLISKFLPNGAGRDLATFPYGDYWRQMRKICISEFLSNKRVRSFSYLREREASVLIESVQSFSSSPINLTEKIFTFTSTAFYTAAFGSKCKDDQYASLVSIVDELISVVSNARLGDLFPSLEFVHVISGFKAKIRKVYQEATDIIDNIINEHRQKITSNECDKVEQEKEDLVDALLRLQNSDLEVPITSNDIKAILMDMFIGGISTTVSATVWTMAEVMRNPRVMAKAQAELREVLKGKKSIVEADIQQLNYLKLIIKETLRLHPPGPLLVPRECRESCEVNGYKIPVNTKVFINAWAIGKDGEHWENAESFIPERFSNNFVDFKGNHFEFIPFGTGKRVCPGISFATANIELPLAALLYHFNWKLPGGIEPEQLDMTERFRGISERKNDLYLVATPYIHPAMTPEN